MSLLNAIRQDTAGLGVQTKARSSTIIPAMVGALLHIHNGMSFVPVKIKEEMVGMKVGQLVATTKPWSFRATNAHKRSK
jgi:ribosomal protein S19